MKPTEGDTCQQQGAALLQPDDAGNQPPDTATSCPSTPIKQSQTRGYKPHPFCEHFLPMPEPEFRDLCESIKTQGLLEPITIHDGLILDGANRYRACMETGVTPDFVNYSGVDIPAFILAKNVHRRHLTTVQQAAARTAATDWAKTQTHGGNRKSDQEEHVPLETIAERAAVSGISVKTQAKLDMVSKADPELTKKVSRGEISLPAAVASIPQAKKKAATKKEASSKEHPQKQPSPGKQVLIRIADLDRTLDKVRTAFVKAEEVVGLAIKSALNLRAVYEGDESGRLTKLIGELNQSELTMTNLLSTNTAVKGQVLDLRTAVEGDAA